MRFNLTIEGHHLEVTPALRLYVEQKLEPVALHFDKVVSVAVVLSFEDTAAKECRQSISVRAHYKNKDIFIEKCNSNLHAAIDECMRSLDRQVVGHKTKVKDHRHVGAKRLAVA